jgi:hypothetical protein
VHRWPDPPRGGKAVLGGSIQESGWGQTTLLYGVSRPCPLPASQPLRSTSQIAPLFKAETVNIAVSASKDGKLRVVYAGWDDAKIILGGPSTGSCLASFWRPQSDRPPPPLLVTSGEGGALSRDRYTSRDVLQGPVDEA